MHGAGQRDALGEGEPGDRNGAAPGSSVLPDRMLGIFGGMGPEATAELYRLIVELTPAKCDQEHIPTLIFSFPQVPDRSVAIKAGDASILTFLLEGVRLLERSGASLIAIPCNTAHTWYDEMQAAVRIPIVHMIRETVAKLLRIRPRTRRAGLLATSGTLQSGIYDRELAQAGVQVVVPDPAIQEGCVMTAVDQIKAGGEKPASAVLLARAAADLERKGAEAIILGCTETPLAFDPATTSALVVDASRTLAEAAIRTFRSQ